MPNDHHYELSLRWTGNRGEGTSSYRSYGRDHELSIPGKPTLLGSSDVQFRGDADRWTPEDLLVAALSECHLLWYLDVAARAGVVVTGYSDQPIGTMRIEADGGGRFVDALLRPVVTIAAAEMRERAEQLHELAGARCFIANSMNFPVRHEPSTRLEAAP
ncbi:MAG: OsmC family protein [Candidatus Dormiibacterota bacterium]